LAAASLCDAPDMGPDGRPPTLEDVAARAHVGRGTASRVLNGSRHVSDAARTAVQQAVDELGYVPNQAARALVTRRTESVALVVSEAEERFFGEPFFAAIVRGVGTALAAARYTLLLSIAQSDDDRDRLERFLAPAHVDGVLLISLRGDDALPGRLESRGVPTVLGGRPAGATPVSFVDVDNRRGGLLAVHHLLQSGRRRVAHVAGPRDMAAGLERLEGYHDAHLEAGVPVDHRLVVQGDFGERSGYQAGRELLGVEPLCDAVFAASDPMALGVLRALAEAGLSVPDDVAVVGFDDSDVARHTSPPLTTVHQPVEEMGREMVRLLLARIAGQSEDLTAILQPELVVRGTG
jgi:DNA-binding LacI/PurR family transcriptional regulator